MLNKKPWKLWEAILLVSPFILSIGFAQLAASKAPGTSAPAEFSMDQFLLNSAIFVAYAACATGILMSKYELNLNDVFGVKTGPLIELLPIAFIIGFAIVPVMLLLQMGCLYLFKQMDIPVETQKVVENLRSFDTPTQIAVFSIMPVIQAPLVEEILFRGILFPAMLSPAPRWLAKVVAMVSAEILQTPIILSTAPRWLAYFFPAWLFAAVHLSLLNFVPLFVLALFLAWQYEKTGNLLCPILTHAGFNLCNILIATGVIPLQNLFPES